MLGVVNHGHNFNNAHNAHKPHNAPEIIDHTVHNDYKEDVSFPQIPPPEFTGKLLYVLNTLLEVTSRCIECWP